MDLALDSGVHWGAVSGDADPVAEALTAWDFARRVRAIALATGKPVAVYVIDGDLRYAWRDEVRYERVLEEPGLVGIYDPDMLMRHLVEDIAQYFA